MEMKRDNPKAFKTLSLRLKELGGVESKIGWFESAVYDEGRPVAAVAAGNELGIPSRSIPPRPFFRTTEAEQSEEWKKTAAEAAKRVLAGQMTGYDAMELLGQKAEFDVAKKIESITAPVLSPITIGARKYRREGKKVTGATIGEIARKLKEGKLDLTGVPTKPLDDTHKMLDTLTHVTEIK